MKKLLLSFTVLLSILLVGCGNKEVVEQPTDPIEDFKNFIRHDATVTSGTVEMNMRYKLNLHFDQQSNQYLCCCQLKKV